MTPPSGSQRARGTRSLREFNSMAGAGHIISENGGGNLSTAVAVF
jgi:hypothetical protein